MNARALISRTANAIQTMLTRSIYLECDSIPYEFHNVPRKKILNWLLVGASMHVKPKSPWGWPTQLQIEPTTLCNLNCALCPVTEGMYRPVGHMSLDLFKKLIDDIGEYVLLALMWDWGEPFVNPSIYNMISYARQKGIKVVSSTNGHAFAKKENAQRLVLSGIDAIIVAIDGITQETYERYRQSGNLEMALAGIRNLVAMKRELTCETPLINFRFLVMKHNEHEIPGLVRLARDLDVDVLSIKTLNPYSNDTYHENRIEKQEEYDTFIPENPRYRRFRYVGEDSETRRVRRNPPCTNLWNTPTVHWNGIVCPCTYDYNEAHVLGDLAADDFRRIWSGSRYAELRRQFRTDWERIELCCNCSYAYEGGSCATETIAKVYFHPRVASLFSRPIDPDRVKPLHGYCE